MKADKKQPAKKSYFFEQGFRDIGDAIRTSWEKNALDAKKYYSIYELNGLVSMAGIYNLLRALSVVTFGTIFFLAISAVMLVFVSVFFVLVYIGFAVVWLFDRAYLTRKKIFTACGECKGKFLIPTYLCPSCNAQHTNLTPGVYGILHRTCNCGKKLPATFFNGRKNLTAICPNCLKEGRMTYLNDRESRPFCVPVVGGRSVGKTAYITAFSRTFIDTVAPQCGLDIEFYNDAKKDIYQEIRQDFAQGSTRMTVRSQDRMQASSISFSFFVKHKSLKPERLMHIYDIAGEVFTDNNENEIQRQYEYCQGIILMVDPFAIPSVRAKYESGLTPQDIAGIGKADLNGVMDVFINKLRQVTGLSENRMMKVPAAIVIGKTDSAGLEEEFSDAKVEEVQRLFQKDLFRSDAVDYLCRRFLRENDMAGFLSMIDSTFSTNRYFAVSAIGHTRDAGEYNPHSVLEPMEWICTKADKTLASLWVTGNYSEKVPVEPGRAEV